MTFSLNVLKEHEKKLDRISARLESLFVEWNKNQDVFKNYFITVNMIALKKITNSVAYSLLFM